MIGTNTNGSKALPNTRDGIRIESAGLPASNNKIGEKNYFTRNIVSGNGQAGDRREQDQPTRFALRRGRKQLVHILVSNLNRMSDVPE